MSSTLLKKNNIVVAGASAVFLLVAIGACVFVINGVSSKKETYTQELTARAVMEQREETLDIISTKLEETEEMRIFLHERILKEENIIDFLSLIESLGREQGVEFTTSGLRVETEGKRFEKFVMNIHIKGSYASVIHFINTLEYLPHQTSLQGLQMTRSNDGTWTAQSVLTATKYKDV